MQQPEFLTSSFDLLDRKQGKEKNAWSDFQRIKAIKRVNSGQTQQLYISKMKTFIHNSFALAVVSCHSVHKLHGRDSFVCKDSKKISKIICFIYKTKLGTIVKSLLQG